MVSFCPFNILLQSFFPYCPSLIYCVQQLVNLIFSISSCYGDSPDFNGDILHDFMIYLVRYSIVIILCAWLEWRLVTKLFVVDTQHCKTTTSPISKLSVLRGQKRPKRAPALLVLVLLHDPCKFLPTENLLI